MQSLKANRPLCFGLLAQALAAALVLVSLVLATPASWATCQDACGTPVPGGLVVNETWTSAGSPYCVMGDIQVSLLTIEPGVCVVMQGDYGMEVLSTMTAVGTQADPITFTALDPSVGWRGLRFENTPPGSELVHCRIEHSDESGLTLVNSAPLIESCTFDSNFAQSGGGLNVVLDSEPPLELTLRDCQISNNVSTTAANNCNNQGNGSGGGAGMRAVVSTGQLTLEDCRITCNRAGVLNVRGTRRGGGLWIDGNVRLTRCLVAGNECFSYCCPCAPGACTAPSRGGGIHAAGQVIIEGCVIRDNFADGGACFTGSGVPSGSGVYMQSGQLSMRNSVVADCTSSGNGPGSTAEAQSAVYLAAGDAEIINCTIVSNERLGLRGLSDTVVENSIVYFNNSGGQQLAGVPQVAYCDVQGGFAGTANLNFNPVLSSGCSLPIAPGSPCIDAGDPATTDCCLPIAMGGTPADIGAHGGGMGECLWRFPEDINRDDAVDVADVIRAILNWGACPHGCPWLCDADLDCDGMVGVSDLVRIILAWGAEVAGDCS